MASINRTIREQVIDQLRDDVVSGKHAAGKPLREEELAAEFGVSRGPIRDAFLQLSQEGLLAYQANRGVTVRNPPQDGHRDFIVSLRRQIEGFVVRRGLKQLQENEFERIEVALAELKAACDIGEIADVARADVGFHEAVLRACGGDDFLPIWKQLCSQMLLTYSRLTDFETIFEEHVRILQALRQQQIRAIVTSLEANIC